MSLDPTDTEIETAWTEETNAERRILKKAEFIQRSIAMCLDLLRNHYQKTEKRIYQSGIRQILG